MMHRGRTPGIAYLGKRIALRTLDDGLAADTLEGNLITDLGVYVYAPALVRELERRRAETGDDVAGEPSLHRWRGI